MFIQILLVGLGGAIGCILRFLIGISVNNSAIGTVIANLIGCFLIGIIAEVLDNNTSNNIAIHIRPFVITGFLGGLTTFSKYGSESLYFIKQNQVAQSILYIFAQLFFCLLLVYLGEILAKKFI